MFINCLKHLDQNIEQIKELKSEKIIKVLSLYGLYSPISLQYPVNIKTWRHFQIDLEN